jgi:hypothetical protein
MATVIFIPTNPPEHYLTLTLRELGFDPVRLSLAVVILVGTCLINSSSLRTFS